MAAVPRLPTDFFAADTSHATWTLGINRYPTLHELGSVAPGQFRIGPHTDFGTITLLSRERGIGGLQVQERSGRWVDAPYLAGSYLMIVGDMLDCWTDGRWPASGTGFSRPAMSHLTKSYFPCSSSSKPTRTLS